MSSLLTEITRSYPKAANVFKRADLRTDWEIRTLTREELHELFPGCEKFQLRRTIFEIIHKQKSVDELLNELKEFIPRESLSAALTHNGVLVDYLGILKEMKSHMNNVQTFLDAHIAVLEEFSGNQPRKESACGPVKSHTDQTVSHPPLDQDPQPSPACGPTEFNDNQTDGFQQTARGTGPSDASGQTVHGTSGQWFPPYHWLLGSLNNGGQTPGSRGAGPSYASGQMVHRTGGGQTQGSGGTCTSPQPYPDQRSPGTTSHGGNLITTEATTGDGQSTPPLYLNTLSYQTVVSGKTFGAHVKLMETVKDQVLDKFHLIQKDQDYEITFVFCPISSRIASDIEAAMTDVTDDKPVILVLMHHTREAKNTTSVGTWRNVARVILYVNVFYHDTVHGLLRCDENNTAVSEIRNKLLEFIQRKDVGL